VNPECQGSPCGICDGESGRHFGFVLPVTIPPVLCYQLPFHHCTVFMYRSLGSGRIWPIYVLAPRHTVPRHSYC
jgi:hypothetical protein